MKRLIIVSLSLLTFNNIAGEVNFQCGDYNFEAIPEAMGRINGQAVTSQQIKILQGKQNGVKVDMTLMPASDGNNYGFEYVHRPDSEVRFLNVQLLQANMDIPPIIASFPCKKIFG